MNRTLTFLFASFLFLAPLHGCKQEADDKPTIAAKDCDAADLPSKATADGDATIAADVPEKATKD